MKQRMSLRLHEEATMKFAARVDAVRELQSPTLRYGDGSQSASGEELRPLLGRTLLRSVLDRAFKGEL
jgi:hypothetical protein